MPTLLENLEQMRSLLDIAIKQAAEPEPQPQPEPQPEPPLQVTVIAKILDSNSKEEWTSGVSKLVPRFVIKDSPENRKAFKVSGMATFGDGGKRRITNVTIAHGNIYPEVEGGLLDPAKAGHPRTVTATADVEDADEEVPKDPEPSPEQQPNPGAKRKGQMGTAIGMGMGKPEVVPGVMDRDFFLPTEDDILRAKALGLRLLRVGSLRERLIKPGGKHELYLGEKDTLPNLVKWLRLVKKHGCQAMTDLFHNYGGFSEGNNAAKSGNPQHKKIGVSGGPSYDMFAQDTKAILQYLQTDPDAWDAVYGIDNMNEWVGLPSDNVFHAHQRFLDVCAPIMGSKMAILEGNAYSNTPNFWDHNPRFKDLKDPRGKGFIEFSGHLYADQDYSGAYKSGDTVRQGENFDTFYINRLKPFLDGCEKLGAKASIGEWIVPGDHPKLLEGSRKGIEYGLGRGCNFIVFGMGRGYSTNASNHWNLEIPRNKPTLEVVKRLASLNQ